MVQKNPSGGQRAVVEPSRFASYLNYLHVAINQVNPEITQGDRQAFEELSIEWSKYKAEIDTLLREDLARFNKLAVQENQSPVAPDQ